MPRRVDGFRAEQLLQIFLRENPILQHGDPDGAARLPAAGDDLAGAFIAESGQKSGRTAVDDST